MRASVVLAFFLAGCASASPKVAVVDLATPFVVEVCPKEAYAFASEWLEFERRHWDVYGTLLYRESSDAAERESLAMELAPNRVRVCDLTRTFMTRLPKDARTIPARVARAVGEAPVATIYFAPALQWTDGRADTIRNEPAIFLNARHDSFADPSDAENLLAHELAHTAIERRWDDSHLPKLERALYREGSAMFVAESIAPSTRHSMKRDPLHPDRHALLGRAAREMLTAIDTNDQAAGDKFFRGERVKTLSATSLARLGPGVCAER
jgi:hypothetical protein